MFLHDNGLFLTRIFQKPRAMAKKRIRKAVKNLLMDTTIISDNIKLNAGKIGRYGMDVPAFTTALDANCVKAKKLSFRQKQLMSELKGVTLELNGVLDTLQKDYALAKKTVKLAEPRPTWTGYGIHDKK